MEINLFSKRLKKLLINFFLLPRILLDQLIVIAKGIIILKEGEAKVGY